MKESESLRLKKYEELYSYAKLRLEDERARFERIDGKISRYFSVLTVLLGFFAVGMGRLVEVSKRIQNFQDWGFIFVYGSLAVFIFLTFISFYRALKLQDIKTVELNEVLIEHYQKNRYIDVLFSVTEGIRTIIKENKEIIEEKVSKATFGYRCILGVIILVPVAIVFYLWSFLTAAPTVQP